MNVYAVTPFVLYPYLYTAEKVVFMSVDFQLNEACIPQARQDPWQAVCKESCV